MIISGISIELFLKDMVHLFNNFQKIVKDAGVLIFSGCEYTYILILERTVHKS